MSLRHLCLWLKSRTYRFQPLVSSPTLHQLQQMLQTWDLVTCPDGGTKSEVAGQRRRDPFISLYQHQGAFNSKGMGRQRPQTEELECRDGQHAGRKVYQKTRYGQVESNPGPVRKFICFDLSQKPSPIAQVRPGLGE